MAKKKREEGAPEEMSTPVDTENAQGEPDKAETTSEALTGPNGGKGIIVDRDLFARMVYSVRRGHGDLFARNAGITKFGAMLGGKNHAENEKLVAELEAPVAP